jgi:hypothetical protein
VPCTCCFCKGCCDPKGLPNVLTARVRFYCSVGNATWPNAGMVRLATVCYPWIPFRNPCSGDLLCFGDLLDTDLGGTHKPRSKIVRRRQRKRLPQFVPFSDVSPGVFDVLESIDNLRGTDYEALLFQLVERLRLVGLSVILSEEAEISRDTLAKLKDSERKMRAEVESSVRALRIVLPLAQHGAKIKQTKAAGKAETARMFAEIRNTVRDGVYACLEDAWDAYKGGIYQCFFNRYGNFRSFKDCYARWERERFSDPKDRVPKTKGRKVIKPRRRKGPAAL